MLIAPDEWGDLLCERADRLGRLSEDGAGEQTIGDGLRFRNPLAARKGVLHGLLASGRSEAAQPSHVLGTNYGYAGIGLIGIGRMPQLKQFA